LKAHGRAVPDCATLVNEPVPPASLTSRAVESAFTVPARDEVRAALPIDNKVLAGLVHEALRDSLAVIGSESTNRVIIEEATRRLVGRARLNPADQLRFLEVAAEELKQIRLPRAQPAPDTTPPSTVIAAANADTETSQAAAVVQAERLAALVKSTDPNDRLAARIYLLSEFADWKHIEIGNWLDLPEREVKPRLDYAKLAVNYSGQELTS
jgi:DNA-directed RNA polymerase specialized sigma24 family protein